MLRLQTTQGLPPSLSSSDDDTIAVRQFVSGSSNAATNLKLPLQQMADHARKPNAFLGNRPSNRGYFA